MELCFYIIDINRLWLVIVEDIFHEEGVNDVTFSYICNVYRRGLQVCQ